MTLTHLDAQGKIRMVDVGNKKLSKREARAECFVKLSSASLRLVKKNLAAKGDVLAAAKLAAISAAKKTAELIPLAHQINLTHVDAEFAMRRDGVLISTSAKTNYSTGVEMEALVAAATAALTVYDMLKASERGIEITGLKLIKKTGGKSGAYEPGRVRGSR